MPDRLLGVISDTHGILRAEAIDALRGCELILHAGDIGPSKIITRLREVAPVRAVRGNCDHGPWAETLPTTEAVSIDGYDIYMIHDLGRLDLDLAAAGFAAVVYGHSHRPSIEHHDSVVYINPGSAGPRRFSLPVSVARLHVGRDGLSATIVELDV